MWGGEGSLDCSAFGNVGLSSVLQGALASASLHASAFSPSLQPSSRRPTWDVSVTGGRRRPGSYGAAEGGGGVTGRWEDKEIPAVFQPLEKALGDLPELSASGCWDASDGQSAHPV